MEYTILLSIYISDLCQEVNEKMGLGWKCQGSLTAVLLPKNQDGVQDTEFYQAMVKE